VAPATGVAKADITGDGLATGLARAAGDDDGDPAAAATHPAVTTMLISGPVDQKRAFLSRRRARPGIE
jgi:hypothetical protein